MAITERTPNTAPTSPYYGFYQSGDPRMALLERTKNPSPEGVVVVPVDLIREVLRLRVCRATMVSTYDEDGPIPEPVTLHCIEQAGHTYRHFNGYMGWED